MAVKDMTNLRVVGDVMTGRYREFQAIAKEVANGDDAAYRRLMEAVDAYSETTEQWASLRTFITIQKVIGNLDPRDL